MTPAACGIDCRVCRLFILGVCSLCGAGTSREAALKEAAQTRLLGAPCPILACARMNRVAHCLRDCPSFPCGNFHSGPYPFSRGFLSMQERRRAEASPAKSPAGGAIQVPQAHWEAVTAMDRKALCRRAGAFWEPPDRIRIPFFKDELRVDLGKRFVFQRAGMSWDRVRDPLLELECLLYLLGVKEVPLRGRMVGVMELKTAHFFQGPHALNVEPLLRRFGTDLDGFCRSAQALGGKALRLGDAAYALYPFPKIPLYYLLWEGDEEFSPRVSILFDETIEAHLAADAIWGLVNLVSHRLLTAEIPRA